MAKQRYRHDPGSRFERIPGPERKYRDLETGKIVSRSYVYARTEKKRISQQKVERKRRERTEGTVANRARWYANHYNHEVWKRNGEPWEYMAIDDSYMSEEFNMYNDFIRSRDADVREIGYDYFRDLEEEYDTEEWGETP